MVDASVLGWAAKRGIFVADGLTITDFPGSGGRGLAAGTKIAAGTAIVRVPAEAALSTQSALECSYLSPLLKDETARFAALPPELIMCLHLLVEKNNGSESVSSDWIATLPTAEEIGNGPFAETDQSTPARRAAAKHVDHLLTTLDGKVRPAVLEWAEAGRLPIPCGATTHDSYGRECLVWALSVVLSRAHAVNVKSACDKQLVMLPVIDMLNHRFPAGETAGAEGLCGVRYEDNSFVALTTAPVDKGQQITISYGPKSNTELLAFYGFCVRDNPHDAAEVYVKLWSEQDPPEMVLAKQSFGLPYVQQLMARGAGVANTTIPHAPTGCMQGTLKWGTGGPPEVEISEELMFAARLGSAQTLMAIGMAVGSPGLSPSAWSLLHESFTTHNKMLKEHPADGVEAVWCEAQQTLVDAAAELAAQNMT